MPWIWLLLAGLCEIAWAIGLKYSSGFSRPVPTILTILGMLLSFYLLSLAMKSLPLGTAYAVWTGIGAVGTAIFGMVYLKEPHDLIRIACLLLIVGGIAGLKATAGSEN